jgi:hypothetical protein
MVVADHRTGEFHCLNLMLREMMLPVVPKMGFQPRSGDALAASAPAHAGPLAVRVCTNWS